MRLVLFKILHTSIYQTQLEKLASAFLESVLIRLNLKKIANYKKISNQAFSWVRNLQVFHNSRIYW